MESDNFFCKDIQYIKGVGKAKALLLNKLGIYNVNDLVEYYPRNYEDRTKLFKISEFILGENALFIGKIDGCIRTQRIRKNLSISHTFAVDDSGRCKLTFFNQTYIKTRLKEDGMYLFYGKVNIDKGIYNIENPQIYNLNELEKIKGIYPIYTLTSGVSQNYIFKLVSSVYDNKPLTVDIFSDSFRKKYNLCEINYAMQNVHFPKNFNSVNIARNRIIFEELFLFQIALFSIKNSTLNEKKENIINDVDTSEFTRLLPFELTGAQKRVIKEIKDDMTSNKIMNRLVQGDVGSGKTMIAACAMYIAVKNGYQAALMAPTTILANQHFDELSKYFQKIGIVCELITSSTTKKNKEKIVERLKRGDIDILIGTHSIIEENIEFSNLGIVITDEQHRFGVKQRVKLTSKGNSVDTLVMTATPIPRTLAIMLYGDLDLSVVDELPPGRTPIKTFVVDDGYNSRVNEFIRKNVNLGRQVYIVCPLVEENEESDLNSVEKIYEEYKNEVFPEFRVEYIHGKMKNKQKDEIMNDFKDNKVNILVSTTVIEVGISVSNATLMVIENADRFGLAALHQLRGRVGRGAHESYCVLKSNNKSQKARDRLKILEKSTNGFEIAQKDLEIRGPGDFFGIRQSGLPEFKLANLLKDYQILKDAQSAAKEIISEDKNLKKEENKMIKSELIKKFGNSIKNIGT